MLQIFALIQYSETFLTIELVEISKNVPYTFPWDFLNLLWAFIFVLTLTAHWTGQLLTDWINSDTMLTLWYYIHRDIRDNGWEQRTKPVQKKTRKREKLNTERLECTIEN